MLDRLSITDFAVARSVVIEPGPGLNVFTGETGSGKSLVVDALVFVFGGRRGREVIATGAERAVVEAVLSRPEGRVVVERSIALSGRSTVRINGEPASLDALRELAFACIDIHGQSEQLAVLRPAVQLAVLDQFAGLGTERDAVAAVVRELREVRRQAGALATDSRERERLIAQLEFETSEIDVATLAPGEETALRGELARLAGSARLRDEADLALDALDNTSLGKAAMAVQEIAARDPSAAGLADLGAALEATADDLMREVRRYRDAIEEDPERLATVQERLDRIARLCRKYGSTVADVLMYADSARQQLSTLTGAGSSLEALLEREQSLLGTLGERTSALSRARRAVAGNLVRAIAAELGRLGMDGASLSVGFACEDDPDGPLAPLPDYEIVITESPLAGEGESHPRAFTESGIDRIEFLASFNAGEAPRPLSAVASGGETSRFLLALTTALGRAAEPRIVVLDEVDEGVGGRAGSLVGEALVRLAERHQVLCITHLPQVAAFGDRHFVVTKESRGGKTWSKATAVGEEARLRELAAMLG
ncbi:MAG TPA: DNA repair protein RecN, partial [Tepidiformaceae bacterium]|nr:DNA repair protein RecN [Tepidiformaceae bacterium]